MKGFLSILYLLLAIILPILNIFGVTNLSWVVALAPIWIPLFISWVFYIFILFIVVIMIIFERRKWR